MPKISQNSFFFCFMPEKINLPVALQTVVNDWCAESCRIMRIHEFGHFRGSSTETFIFCKNYVSKTIILFYKNRYKGGTNNWYTESHQIMLFVQPSPKFLFFAKMVISKTKLLLRRVRNFKFASRGWGS